MPVQQLEIPGELAHLGWLIEGPYPGHPVYAVEWRHTHNGHEHALRFYSNESEWTHGLQAKELEEQAIRYLNNRKKHFDKLFS